MKQRNKERETRPGFSKIGASESNVTEAWRLCLSVRIGVKLGQSRDGCYIYVKYFWLNVYNRPGCGAA